MVECMICNEELLERNPGIDNWMNDTDDVTDSFIVREMTCVNEKCPLFEKQQDIFFNFDRVDIDGDLIDAEELTKEYNNR